MNDDDTCINICICVNLQVQQKIWKKWVRGETPKPVRCVSHFSLKYKQMFFSCQAEGEGSAHQGKCGGAFLFQLFTELPDR